MNIFNIQKRKRQKAKGKMRNNSSFCTLHFALCTDSGFSLVEMMVAIAIFMVVAVVAVAALLKIVDADRKSKTLQDTVNNINFAMDSITREIRVGSDYNGYTTSYGGSGVSTPGTNFSDTCTNASCSNGTNVSIVFLSSKTDTNDASNPPHNLTYVYYFAPHPDGVSGHWTIMKAQQVNYSDTFSAYQNTSNLGSYAEIIDPSIVITAYSIKVVEGDPNTQPSVFLYIKGYTGKDVNTQTYFDLQTTISERI